MLPSGNDAAIALAEYFGEAIFQETKEYKDKTEYEKLVKTFKKTENRFGNVSGQNELNYYKVEKDM